MNHRSASRRRARENKAARPAVAADGESGVDVWEALGHLNLMERAVLFLVYWEDLLESDVGERLGVSDRTVRRHLAAGRRKLGRLLS